MAPWVSGGCTACGPSWNPQHPCFLKKASMAIFPEHGAEEEAS